MIDKVPKVGWISDREYIFSAEEQKLLNELRQKDEKIALIVESKYGKQYIPTFILVRVIRRLRFEALRLGSLIFGRFVRIINKIWRTWVLNQLAYKGPNLLLGNGTKIEIVSLSTPAKLLIEALQHTDSTHWILLRPDAKLLNFGVTKLIDASVMHEMVLHYGDSSTFSGVVDRRPRISHLLQRQIDISGPVVMCTTKFLNRIVREDIDTELWPLQLFLNAKEDQINQITDVLAIGNLWDSISLQNQQAAIELVMNELANSKIEAQITMGSFGQRVVSYAIQNHGKVSILIPTRGTKVNGEALVVHAVKSLIDKTTYPDFEIIVVADNETHQDVINQLELIAGEKLSLVRWNEAFNFSKKMNLGSLVSSGEYLLFLNDDVELVSPRWIDEMVGLLEIEEIGYVGALLFFQDGTIQHAGHFYESGAGHIAFKQPFKPQDPRQLYSYDRKVSGMTAACALVPRSIFNEVGGFSELFPGNYNDVDFALKVNELGYDSAVASNARLYHFESKSRDATVTRPELLALHRRWYTKIQKDAWYRGL